MAITTLDLLIAGFKPPVFVLKNGIATVVGLPYSPFYVAGTPGAAVAPSPGIGGAALTTYAGQIPMPANFGNTHLGRMWAQVNAAGTLLLCDRLWHNSGVSSTLITAQTVNSVAWPARDANGSTNGDQVLIGMEVSTIMGAGAGNATLSYTNSAGTAGKSSVKAYVAANPVGSFLMFDLLAAGDSGVRSIQTLTWSVSRTSGTVHLVAFRILAAIPLAANTPLDRDGAQLGIPRMYDNTVPFFVWIPTATTAPVIQSQIICSQG